ncbi:MAG TPA: hypothetical protein VMV45_19605 [Casimicrobiaceae bacterium]|nr:hypothetical protein [Casimicrobiaceae bacterium]
MTRAIGSFAARVFTLAGALCTLAGAATMPGTGTVVVNPYGPLLAQGAALSGNTVSNLQSSTVIQLGTTPGASGDYCEIDFTALSVGAGGSLMIMSGAANQSVVLYGVDGNATAIAGQLVMLGGNGAPAPKLYLKNPNGVTVYAGGIVTSPSGLTIDTLGAAWTDGQPLVNNGSIDGGTLMWLYNAGVTGGGAFKGNGIGLATFGNANNPVNGLHFLANGLQLFPSSGSSVSLAIGHYGFAAQVLNLNVNGNVSLWMPSSWPAGYINPANSTPVLAGQIRAAGVPDPAYGAGSVIVQSTGNMSLVAGAPYDFAFPGGIVLKAAGTLDLNGVTIENGWTAAGVAFQGMYFESPNIVSSAGKAQLLTNNFNWVNFSTQPHASIGVWQLVQQSDGSAQYVAADAIAPHINTYSTLIDLNASGQCWTCVMNAQPVSVQ